MFMATTFNQKVTAKNPTMGRYKKSSLDPLMNVLAGIHITPNPTQKKAIQEAVFDIPYDKQVRYADALGYMAQECGVKICGRPVKPVMTLESFRTSNYLYHAFDSAGKPNVNIGIPNHTPVVSLHHVFKFRYQSSTGNMASLASVGTREHVKFRTQPGGPPFTQAALGSTPIEFHHGESTSGANVAAGLDDHMTKPPCLICRWPLQADELVADQWYQYTIDNGVTWENIPGAAYNLIKGVRKSGNTWVFYFIKKNWAPHNTVNYKFEAEYAINPPSPQMDPSKPLGKCGQAEVSNIKAYAHKVISMK